MSDETLALADQWARISRQASELSRNDLLEKKLLGLEQLTDTSSSNGGNESTSAVHIEVSAVYTTGQQSSSADPLPVPPTFNPLFPSNDRLVLVASGTLLAVSAVALSVYLSGGLTAAAASAGSIVASSPSSTSSALDNFNYFFRGGSANYATGRASVALLSLQKQLGVKPASTYLSKRAIPSALRVLKKMFIMEIWRRVWLVTFHQMAKGAKSVSRGTVHMYQKYTPLWIRRGFQSLVKSSVQKAVHGTVGQWAGVVAAGASDFVAGMFNTQFESAVHDAAEEVIETALDVAAEVVSDTDTCCDIVEAVIGSASDAVKES